MRGESLGDEDGRRPVHGPDDPDAARLQRGETQGQGEVDGDEYAQLARGCEEQEFGLPDEAGEIAHGPDADEEEGREELVLDAIYPDGVKDPPWVRQAREGDVGQDRSEAYRKEEEGLVLLGDGQVDEDQAYAHHDEVPDERPHIRSDLQ